MADTGAMAFEPETAAFVAAVAAAPPTEGLGLNVLRAGYEQTVIANSVAPDPGVTTVDDRVPSAAGDIAVRLYTPAGIGTPSGLLLYVHGGGFAVGSIASHDALIRLIATEARVRVLALDYRRAPEHPFPAALDDVQAVFSWARANAGRIGIDPSCIAIGGESAGGTHAVAAALAITAADPSALAALWVFVPALDPDGKGASHSAFATGAGRTASEFRYLWSLYLPDAATRSLPGAIPGLGDPSSLPATYIYTAEYDPARDDGEAFAARAQAAGIAVTLRRQIGLVHQFPEITGLSPGSRAAVVEAAADLRAAIG